ncbi:YcgN family cysteine cluster protein [Spirabiliibacterium falconis]|uniref:YcgN family cysteine cluster protein n=1 Tax=Spirabiliibacterium falconis TaxID=572023 RepID=UPI001F2BF328
MSFWEKKTLTQLSEQEWEQLCDGCGLCCFHKMIDGYGIHEKLYFTRIACDQLDLRTCQCSNYSDRFTLEPECTKLTRENLAEFAWLPETCAYRLRAEGKPLFAWHPLISGSKESVKRAGIAIQNGVHARNVRDWSHYVIAVQNVY